MRTPIVVLLLAVLAIGPCLAAEPSSLPRGYGRITISTTPSGMPVFMDGSELGFSTISELQVRSGKHVIEVGGTSSWKRQSLSLDVVRNKHTLIHIYLKRTVTVRQLSSSDLGLYYRQDPDYDLFRPVELPETKRKRGSPAAGILSALFTGVGVPLVIVGNQQHKEAVAQHEADLIDDYTFGEDIEKARYKVVAGWISVGFGAVFLLVAAFYKQHKNVPDQRNIDENIRRRAEGNRRWQAARREVDAYNANLDDVVTSANTDYYREVAEVERYNASLPENEFYVK